MAPRPSCDSHTVATTVPAAEHEAALRKCEQLQETVWELEELRRSQVITAPAQHPVSDNHDDRHVPAHSSLLIWLICYAEASLSRGFL